VDGGIGLPLPHQLEGKCALPLIAAPMFLVSGPDLVVAACREGIIGSFPTPNARTLSALDEWLDDISGRTESVEGAAPFAANIVVHPSNARLDEDLALIKNTKCRLSSPPWEVHEKLSNVCTITEALFSQMLTLCVSRAMRLKLASMAWCLSLPVLVATRAT